MIGSWLRNGNRRLVFLADVVEQPGDRERLAVAQLDFGFAPSATSAPESGSPQT